MLRCIMAMHMPKSSAQTVTNDRKAAHEAPHTYSPTYIIEKKSLDEGSRDGTPQATRYMKAESRKDRWLVGVS